MRLAEDQRFYSVGEVVELTQLNPQLLHTWERRYSAVQPVRDQRGSRVYNLDEVRRLQLLKQCIDSGQRIGKLTSLTNGELKFRIKPILQDQRSLLGELIDATKRMDATSLEDCLSDQIGALGAVHFANDIAFPLLRTVGSLWQKKQISIASEHLLTAVLRSLLGQALQTAEHKTSGPRVLFATPEKEQHELGALCAALCAQSAGLQTYYLGADLPAEEMIRACSVLDASLICISATCGSSGDLTGSIECIAPRLRGDVEIWIGGAASEGLEALTTSRIKIFKDISNFDEALHRFRLLHWDRP